MKMLKRLTVLALAAALFLTACGEKPEPSADPEPEESGYSATGRNNPNVPKNEYDADAFVSVGGFTVYTAADGASHIGVDVSTHQGDVDWAQVKQAGVEFAMIRAGFRGYTGGGIYQDDRFEANIEGALDAGLKVGVYFFSQAVNTQEAREEARAVLDWLEPYEVDYPVVFDWENIPNAEARTDDVQPETVTECAKAFCDTAADAGYIPMVYFNRNQGYDVMDLEQLAEYDFWLAGYTQTPDFVYSFDMWQYSCTGTVPGIDTVVDLDICFVDYPRPAESEEEPETE